ncbi:HAD-IIIA family hydrolase [Amycolatopsis sp. FDAARGOS 1241]|uniref:HAD-IIIA family hydrolase n=1 Tax=Amycolatopsis sp. FDAARGOS 1241 TaxID=2778070 RepID=UPI00194F4A9A|nr:HAD-IIIA family hydrolase [Amycolatopsis sp. FDAARGOS 1241]QRP49713.1 HAD-IIIA family hydrolase [Amycolatopsis sp. FDAARGOS 1241]
MTASPDYAVVIPTTGRDTLRPLLETLLHGDGPRPAEVIVVDDRPGGAPLTVPPGVRVLRSSGRGPAAARNLGWRTAAGEWIAFVDDDVVLAADWPRQLAKDLMPLPPEVAASQARITVPLPADRRPTDDERGTAGLEHARWITADMAYRRSALVEAGGFDERFPRAFREDSDLALRVTLKGHRIVRGDRITTHPARAAGFFASVKAQRGNADNALMRAKHGALWRQRTGEGRGRLGEHAVSTVAGVAAVAFAARGLKGKALLAASVWAGLTAEFAARRVLAGPPKPGEVARMAVTSALIPPVACYHRLRGAISARRRRRPVAVLFDRDDTLITDIPYLDDPEGVRPVPGAADVIQRLRDHGIPVGVVSNQSGVAKGRITPERLEAVNTRVEELLGPFGTWQVCVHDDGDGCGCRKPAPGLILRAASDLGVDPASCVVIGDTGGDVRAALAAGARAVLVPTDRTLDVEVAHARRYAAVARDLSEALRVAGVAA